jgi:hypothetical protein
MKKRNGRVLWLLNHKTLMPYEVPLLRELGFEVFVPKVIPGDVTFRSGTIDFSYDASLSIPSSALRRLNSFNFYESVWPADIVTLVNRYFGIAFVIPHASQFLEAVRKFEGQVVLRAFGLDNTMTYVDALEILYGWQVLEDIRALGGRFWFGEGYEQLHECEPPLLSDRAIFLPLGVPPKMWQSPDSWTGGTDKILFICPNFITNPYYAEVYRKFKAEFGDLPHVIVGAQDVPTGDPSVAGFVSNEELERLYRECAVLYYHSTELRHVHYSPVEAAINGMPVVYYADSLLGRMTPEGTAGRVQDYAEARAAIERILNRDTEFTTALRAGQRSLAYKFSDEYCKASWTKSLANSGLKTALAPEAASGIYAREVRRAVTRVVPERLLRKTRYEATLTEEEWARSRPDLDPAEQSAINQDINFTDEKYPAFVKGVTGLSYPEVRGRWSVGEKITIALSHLLDKKLRISIVGFAYGPNVGARASVRVGKVKRAIRFSQVAAEPQTVYLDFELRRPASVIEITVPKPVVPPGDSRSIGLGLTRLRIERLT